MEPKELVKQSLDIAELIGEYVQLKPAGTGSLKGICPFHQERSPSFHVSRDRQIFKCFGCDKGGDIFSFLMEMEGITFAEALRMLASRAGVVLPAYQPQSQEHEDERLRYLALYKEAATYYATSLREFPAGARARSYCDTRGIDGQTREVFQLGAASEGWDGLVTWLHKRGYRDDEMVRGGLALERKNGSGVFDRFRDRLMVPISDAQGNVIAFTGRVLPGGVHPPDAAKYVNSPETILYKKGEVVYGLSVAKQAIRKQDAVIIVEGNLDVISSHQAGVQHVVASSGTALTPAQLKLLSRYTKRFIFCLDGDSAGFSAAKRVLAFALALQQQDLSYDIRCISIPPQLGKDPDDVVRKDPQAWRDLVERSVGSVAYVFERTFEDFHIRFGETLSLDARKALIDALLPYLQDIVRSDERHLYLLQLADATHVSPEVLIEELARRKKPQETQMQQPQQAKGQGGVVAREVKSWQVSESLGSSPRERAQAFLFMHALSDAQFTPFFLEKFAEKPLEDPWNILYEALKTVYTASQERSSSSGESQSLFTQLRAYLDDASRKHLSSVLDRAVLLYDEIVAGLSQSQKHEEARRHFLFLARARMEDQKKSLEAAIRQAEAQGNLDRLHALLAQYSALLSEFRKMR